MSASGQLISTNLPNQQLQTESQDSSLASVRAFCSISCANWLSCLNLRDLWQKLMALLSCPLRWQMNPREKKVCELLELRLTHCSRKQMAFLYSLSFLQACARLVRMVSMTQKEASGWHSPSASWWLRLASLQFFCLQCMTPSSEQMSGSVGLISLALRRERVAVLRLFVRRYSMPMQRWACAQPGKRRTMVRQMDMAWSDSSCTAKECAMPIHAKRKLLSSMIAFWKYFRATSYFLQWKQQVPTVNQLTGCEEQFSTRLCAQQQSSPVRPRSSRQVAQIGSISKQSGSFLMALRHSSQASGIWQFWQRVLARMHRMCMFWRVTSASNRLSLRTSSSGAGGAGSSRGLILERQILRSHWSSGGKLRVPSSCSFWVPVMSWQSTRRLKASTLVRSFWMHSWQNSTAISLFSCASQHCARMKARQLSILRLQQVCQSWSQRVLRHCSYCLFWSRARAARIWKLMLWLSSLYCWNSECTFLKSPFRKQHSPSRQMLAMWELLRVTSLSAKKMASGQLCTLRLSMVSSQSLRSDSLASTVGAKLSSSWKWCSGCAPQQGCSSSARKKMRCVFAGAKMVGFLGCSLIIFELLYTCRRCRRRSTACRPTRTCRAS